MFSNSDAARQRCLVAKEVAEKTDYDIKTLLSDRVELANSIKILLDKVKNNLAKRTNKILFPNEKYDLFINAFDAQPGS